MGRTGPRRTGRRLAFAAGGFVLFCAAALILLFIALQTERVQTYLAATLSGMLSTPGEEEIVITGLGGMLPHRIEIERIEISDGEGVWLAVSDIYLDWRPLALLRNRISIRRFTLSSADLFRLPEEAEEEEEAAEEFSLPLPLLARLSIEDLRADVIRLGEDVTGEAVSMRLEGGTTAQDGIYSTSVRLGPLSREAGGLSWQSEYRHAQDHLTIDFEARAQRGGPVMRLLGMEERHADLRLHGAGPVDGWQGQLETGLQGLVSLESGVSLSRQDTLRFALDGRADVSGLEDESLNALAGPEPVFHIAGFWDVRETLVFDAVRLDGRAAAFSFDGLLKAASGSIEGTLTAALKEERALEDIVPGLFARHAALQVSLRGALPWPDVEAQFDAQALKAGDMRADKLSASFEFKQNTSWLGLRGARRDVRLLATLEGFDAGEPGLPGGGLVTARAEGLFDPQTEILSNGLIALDGAGLKLDGTAEFDLAQGGGAADMRLSAQDLALFAPLAGVDLKGAGEGRFDAVFPGGGEAFSLDMSAMLREFSTGIDALDALTGGSVKMRAEAAGRADGAFEVPEIEAEAAHFSLEAGIWADAQGALRGRYRFDVPRMQVLNAATGANFTGPLTLRGTAEGTLAHPAVAGDIALDHAGLGEAAFRDLRLSFTGRNLAGAPDGGLELAGQSDGGALAAALRYRVEGGTLALSPLSLSLGDARASGALQVPLDGSPLSGELSLAAENVSPLLALAGMRGTGTLDGTVRLIPDGVRQSMRLEAELRDAVLADGNDEIVSAARLGLAGDLQDLMGAARFSAQAQGETLALGEVRLEEITLGAEGDAEAFGFETRLNGRFRGPLQLEAAGDARFSDARSVIRLSSLDGVAIGRPFRLQEETVFTSGENLMALEGVRLGFGDARLDADMRADARAVTLALSLADLDVAVLDAFWETGDLQGTLSASADIEGPRANPQGTLRLHLKELTRANDDGIPLSTFDIRSDWAEGRLRSSVLFAENSGTPQQVGSLDMALVMPREGAFPIVPGDAPLSGRFGWAGEIGTWWALVPFDEHRLRGRTELDIVIAGTADTPDVSGRFAVSDGAYENLDIGLLLRPLTLVTTLEDSRVTLERLSGADGGSGRLSAEAWAMIDPSQNFPFEFKAEFDQFTAMRRDDVTARAGGAVRISGNAARAALEGRIESQGVLVRIPDHFPPEVAVLDVVETGAGYLPPVEEDEEQAETGFVLSLDLGVSLPRRVFVRGRGLDSEWEGDLRVSGTAEDPRLTGDLNLVRGYFSILTKNFELRSGAISFRGSPDLVPNVDVLAENRTADLLVRVRATGPADNPDIALSSVPSLPDDEIVSRMLFGKSRASLSAIEAAQLALAVAELTGVSSGGPGILDFARGALGVDVLRIDGGEGEGAAVEAGSYLTDGVFVGFRQGITDDSSAVSVEVELTPNISLRSETGASGENDVGIQFKWDY